MVDVNNVYRKVQAIANKEQRGYITPQEFNLLADKAQKDIVNTYFDDMKTSYHKPTKNQSEAGDEMEFIREKLSSLRKEQTGDLTATTPIITINANCLKIGTVAISTPSIMGGRFVEATEVGRKELTTMLLHPLTEPTLMRPVYFTLDINQAGTTLDTEGVKIEIHTWGTNTFNAIDLNQTNTYRIDYFGLESPAVAWNYVVVSGKALYNANTSSNFCLHLSEEENLVGRILQLAGIMLQRPDLLQAALTNRQLENQEKNN